MHIAPANSSTNPSNLQLSSRCNKLTCLLNSILSSRHSAFKSMKLLPLLFGALAFAPRAAADVTVSAPASGATVNTSFTLTAQAPSCQNQSTASMAYSFDDQTDTFFQGATSIDTTVSTTVGSHVLRVKAWGSSGALCQANVPINASSSAVAVVAPVDGANIPTTFLLKAEADSCQGQATASMAYAFDQQSDTILNGATVIDQRVTTTSGSHTLRVKAWGNSGAFCETDLNITAGSSSVEVDAPAPAAGVGNPFSLQAVAPTCGGQPTTGMAYSFEYLQDVIVNGATSLNNMVKASSGLHLLRVKAWGNSGAFCETDVEMTVTDQAVVINAPANNAVLNSPMLLNAASASCQGQTTSSMAYSFDYQADNFFNGSTSIDTQASTSPGEHTLRVKSWGNSGAFCESDLQIIVSSSSVTVSTPSSGSSVPSPFSLQAQASSCSGQSTASMAYSFDYQTDTIVSGATSLNVSPTATPGPHILRVKAWGSSGAFCETDLDLTIANDGVSVSSPADGQTVDSPFGLHATAASCQSQPTASMAYSFDEQTDTILNGATSINTSVSAPSSGAHLLRVKAWGNSGGFCETDLNLTINQVNQNPPPGLIPTPPSNAVHVANIDDMSGWGSCTDPSCGAPPGQVTFGPTTANSYDGSGLGVSICCGPWFGDLFYNNVFSQLNNQIGTNYLVQWRFKVDQPPPAVWAVEFDFPLASTQLDKLFYFGTQCENGTGGSGTWDIWNPNLSGGNRWVHTSVPCGSIDTTKWHEVRWYGTRTDSEYQYSVLEFDGTQYPINQWVAAEVNSQTLNWGDAFVVQFQADGDAAGDGYNMYVDDIQAWVW